MTVEDFLSFSEPLPEPVLLVRFQGTVMAANTAARKVLGRELAGQQLHELVADDGRKVSEYLEIWSSVRQAVPGALTWKSPGGELAMRCDGNAVDPEETSNDDWLVLRCTESSEDSREFSLLHEQIAALAREVAERRRVDEALRRSQRDLRESHDLLENTLESISDCFSALDFNWRYIYVNENAARMMGVSTKSAIGKTLWDLFPGLLNPNFEGALRRSMTERVPVHLEEYYEPHKPCLMHDAYPTRNGLVLFTRDVTARREFEDQLRQTQKLESLGVLAGGVAHDFNNLLVGILGNASLALEGISPNSPVRLNIRSVIDASEQAASLTRQLLAYAGKGRLVVGPIDLPDLVRQIAHLIQSSIPKSVNLRLDLSKGLPTIEGDATQLQQLIMNLVINGAEAIEAGTGSVVVSAGAEEVDEDYARTTFSPQALSPGHYVSLEVHDTGVGMTEEVMARIFDPFFTTKVKGRGLGLAAVVGIVRGHRGGIRVYSTPGKGSTFKVLLPASGKPAAKTPEPARPLAVGAGQTILVVDDEDVVRRTAKSMLERFGFRVLLAENGREAVDVYRALAPRVAAVLLDMTMPVMDGEPTFRELKSIDPHVRVILSSGYTEVEAVQRFTGKGLAGFLQKPYSAARLAEKMREALEPKPAG